MWAWSLQLGDHSHKKLTVDSLFLGWNIIRVQLFWSLYIMFHTHTQTVITRAYVTPTKINFYKQLWEASSLGKTQYEVCHSQTICAVYLQQWFPFLLWCLLNYFNCEGHYVPNHYVTLQWRVKRRPNINNSFRKIFKLNYDLQVFLRHNAQRRRSPIILLGFN